MAGKDLIAHIRSKLDAMEPAKRINVIRGAVIGGLVTGMVGLYYLTGQDAKKPPPPAETPVGIELGDARLEDDIRAQVAKERLEGDARNTTQDAEIKAQKEKIAQQEAQMAAMQAALEAIAKNPGLGLPDVPAGSDPLAPNGGAPNDPAQWGGTPTGAGTMSQRPLDPNAPPPAPPPVEFLGSVGRAKPEGVATAAPGGDGSKKNVHRFYLPTSFMPAKLLTGLKAKTVDSAKGDPEPMLLRVQAPAVLPNEVRAQLEGCLVVAHGYGSLASERVEARLVSLSCLDFEGKSLIDAELHGIVADSDGVKGLAGHPVAKMGTNLARLAFANAIQGAASAFAQSAQTTSVSPLGQTTSIDPSAIGRAGAGRGVEKGADEYAKIIADLVRQQAPVIEVGPGKDVTVIVTEGTWLEVKDYEDGPGESQRKTL